MLRDTIPAQQLTQTSDGILLFYDNSRSSYLSTTREIITYGIDHRNISKSRWMLLTGRIQSNISGYKIPRNGVITCITIQTKNNVLDCSFDIKRNDVFTNLTSVTLVTETSKINNNLNIEINEGDWLQVFMTVNSGNVDYPILLIELAWRE